MMTGSMLLTIEDSWLSFPSIATALFAFPVALPIGFSVVVGNMAGGR